MSKYNEAGRSLVLNDNPNSKSLDSNTKDLIDYVEAKGKAMYGSDFMFEPSDISLVEKFICYFKNDEIKAKELNIDLSKGILLTGFSGMGKTTLFKLFQSFFTSEKGFWMRSCRDISLEYAEEGYQTILRYGKQSKTVQNQVVHFKTYCFDDFGIETDFPHFGVKSEIMSEILHARYDLFNMHKVKTHLITSLSAKDIEARYGSNIRFRMKKMFNHWVMDGGDRKS